MTNAPADAASSGRLIIRPDVRSTATFDGVYVTFGSQGFLLKGSRIAPIVERLLASLATSRAVGEIRAALPEVARPLLDTLLERLAAHGMLTEAPSGKPITLASKAVIRFLQNQMFRWESCAEAWARQRITIWAQGEMGPMIASGLVVQEVGRVSLVDDGGAREALLRRDLTERVRLVRPDEPAEHRAGDMLLACIDGPIPRDALALANRFRRIVPSKIVDGGIVIGPEMSGDLAKWSAAAPPDAHRDRRPSCHALNVAAAMHSFEAFRNVAVDFADDPDLKEARRAQTRFIRVDGTVTSYDERVARVSGRLPVAGRIARPLIDRADPWYDPEVGTFCEEPSIGKAFPLPQAALRVCQQVEGSACTHAVQAWGLTPAEASSRCRLFAFQVLEEIRGGIIVAARSKQECEDAVSLVVAAIRFPWANARSTEVDLDGDQSREVRMLARLARLYWRESPLVHLRQANEISLAKAEVGGYVAIGIGITADDAVREAIGEAMSMAQMGCPTFLQVREPRQTIRAIFDLGSGNGAGTAVNVEHLALVSLPDDVFVGRIAFDG